MAVAERILHLRPLADLRSDRALVKAAQSGKADAASALIERHYRRVHTFISYLTRPAVADDLTQEVFTRALGALGRFNGQYQFEPWLLRIARNLVID
ncbi:MAG: sigma-70 family RNA polymerase sigma factor, partial [Actinobacteria bacterium]|nr:sigma-70 family RNA polymerase sigma factor [Actinomycetota bacterium]